MILQLEQIAKSFGSRELFSGVSLSLEEFDRLALVGPNGAGKTTLLNIISGKDEPDEGRVIIAKNAQVGYLEQEAIEMGDNPIFEEVLSAQHEVVRQEQRLRELEAALGEDPSEAALAAYGKASDMYEAMGGYTLESRVRAVLFGLGFKEEPLPFGDLRSEMLYELILCCICGGMSPLYRRLYDEGLTNPGFGGEVLRVDGCCCILFTGESDQPDTVRQLLLDEIERVRKEGVDREIFTLCKNEKYGQLIENLENVEDSASQMADFALAGQTVAQQITMLAGLTAEDADAALQHILRPERMAVMYIEPDGTAVEDEEEEETEE